MLHKLNPSNPGTANLINFNLQPRTKTDYVNENIDGTIDIFSCGPQGLLV